MRANGLLSRRVWLIRGTERALLAIGLLYYLNSRRPVPQVTLAQVTRGNLNSWITSNGKVEPVNPYALRAKFDAIRDRRAGGRGQRGARRRAAG